MVPSHGIARAHHRPKIHAERVSGSSCLLPTVETGRSNALQLHVHFELFEFTRHLLTQFHTSRIPFRPNLLISGYFYKGGDSNQISWARYDSQN